MKKISALAMAAAFSFAGISMLQAKDKSSAAGGLELSGNVTVLTGWQHDSKNAQGASVSPINDADAPGSLGLGALGEFRGASASKHDTFNFYIDQVELDLNKTFGDNVRVRADLDFSRSASTNVTLEQAYVTANIPVGSGAELLVGRFNAPIGLESVDRHENIGVSYSNLYKYLRPHNVTGAKLYYAFNENFDFHLYAVNNLYDTISNDTPVPSAGARIGFNWGEKGKENVIGLSYAGGPEAAVNGVSKMKHWTHIGDLDFMFHITDAFTIAGEGIYRQDNRGGACISPAAGASTATSLVTSTRNCKAFAGQVALGYNFNENWNAWLKYDYMHDIHGNYSGNDQQLHGFSVGAGYNVAEGAKIKGEYRLDLNRIAGPGGNGNNNAFALEFAYNF